MDVLRQGSNWLADGYVTWRSPPKPCPSCPHGYVSLLVLLWYVSSAVTSLTTKEILRSFPYPITVATVQQIFAAACGGLNVKARGSMPAHSTARLLALMPVVLAMVTALISYRWSLLTVSVKFTHTIKTLGPVFTIALSRLLLLERFAAARYAAVAPVVLGVALTSITEADFALLGFLADKPGIALMPEDLTISVDGEIVDGGAPSKNYVHPSGATRVILILPPRAQAAVG